MRVGKMDEEGENIDSTYKTKQSWRYNVQGD